MYEAPYLDSVNIPVDQLHDLVQRLRDIDEYVAEEADRPGANRYRDDLIEKAEYLSSLLE